MTTEEIYQKLEPEVEKLREMLNAEKAAKSAYNDLRGTDCGYDKFVEAEDNYHAAHMEAGCQAAEVDGKLRDLIDRSEVPYAKTRQQMIDKFYRMAKL